MTHLNKAIDVVTSEQADHFTTDSWQFMTNVLLDAKKVRDLAINSPEKTTQSHIDDITQKLVAAHVRLEAISKADFNKGILATLNQLIQKQAQENPEKVTKAQLDEAIQKLTKAREQLVSVSNLELNTVDLDRAIESAEKKVESDYTTVSWASFMQALQEAKDLKGQINQMPESVTQQVIDEVTTNLVSAENALVNKSESKDSQLDLNQLNSIIQASEKIAQSHYTKDSLTAFNDVLKEAIILQEKAQETPVDVTQAQVDQMVSVLQTAKNNLVLVSSGDSDQIDQTTNRKGEPETGQPQRYNETNDNDSDSQHNINSASNNQPSGVNQTKTLPQTGEEKEYISVVGLVLMFMTAIFKYYRDKTTKTI